MKKIFLSLLFLSSAYAQVDVRALNVSDSIRIVRGDGSRKIYVFEDPNCGFCKSFETQIRQVDNVTLHVFLYPILGADSLARATSIWCSPNRAYSWQAWMTNNTPAPPANCNNPIQNNMAVGKMFGMAGTPSIVFGDGTLKIGVMSAYDIEQKFDSLYGKTVVPAMANSASNPKSNTSKTISNTGTSLFK